MPVGAEHVGEARECVTNADDEVPTVQRPVIAREQRVERCANVVDVVHGPTHGAAISGKTASFDVAAQGCLGAPSGDGRERFEVWRDEWWCATAGQFCTRRVAQLIAQALDHAVETLSAEWAGRLKRNLQQAQCAAGQ